MLFGKYRYIVVEGPVGAGKTSLARRLAEHFRCGSLLENPDANPFLARFYDDITRYALPTQLFFLFQRVNQLRGLAQMDMFDQVIVSDFILDKDALFARLNLSDDEYGLYHEVYRHLEVRAPAPDLVIYLQASAETLIERVRRRGHEFEKNISEEYLARLAESYSRFFYHYDAAQVLIVNSENLNFVDNSSDFDLLLQRVAAMRGAREFFNRGE